MPWNIILLPELKETIKFIKAKLDEAERSHISRLIKIKRRCSVAGGRSRGDRGKL
ncbi:MAG: V-type ATP synthase subunit D [Candidatus Brocadiaceae bacterium]|nr:V-type ATP synthase subunit D [Candidatus Brocadiaceae bacterium]